jgi:hypothetical protein
LPGTLSGGQVIRGVPAYFSLLAAYGGDTNLATNKTICRIWNITIYRLVVISETIHRTVHRKMKERENLHDGIWIIIPAPTVVSDQVLLDRHPGTLDRVHDTPVQL